MKKHLKKISLLLFLCFVSNMYAVDDFSTTFSKVLLNNLTNQWTKQPQEKLYVQTDKPYYCAGENIWLKAYVVNATTHEPNTLSQYIYAELINQSDSVIYRAKIRKDSTGFSGNIYLKPEIAAGNYVLRAYTYWMQNAGSDFFFQKNIIVGNPIDDNVLSQIAFSEPANGKVTATITLTNGQKSALTGKRITLYPNWKLSTKKEIKGQTDANGQFSLSMPLDTNYNQRKYLDLSINEENLKYKKTFYIPKFSTDFDVQFFPESGAALDNQLQCMAFKAIGTDGMSVEITGSAFTDSNELITEFNSSNKGMGKFSVSIQAGHLYYVVAKSAAGIEKRFNLPLAKPEGVSLHLLQNRGKIRYEVINQTTKPCSSLYLLLHQRGKVLVSQQLSSPEGQIDEKDIPTGIISCSVVDSLGNVLCERLCFVKNALQPKVTMNNQEVNYGKRQPVNLNFQVNDEQGQPISGSFSISITDNHSVHIDSLKDNILSNLLLTSDLKGHIEDPASYFMGNSTIERENLDLLMLTQGWRRFNTNDVTKGQLKRQEFYMEAGQGLSGKVKNLFGKLVKNADIIMMAPSLKIMRLTKTDSLGNYLITGIEFPDSTTFVLKAKKKKTIGDVEIIPDGDLFPKTNSFFPYTRIESESITNDYLRQSRDKYFFEGGMRVIGLNEVVVTAAKIDNQTSSNSYFSGMADSHIRKEDLERNQSMSILNLISTIPGVSVIGDRISIRGNTNNPMLMIDGIETENTDDLSYLNANDVEDIAVFKGASAAIFGSRGGNGVIAISLKTGYVPKAKISSSLTQVTPLGYQKPSEFYVPKYELDSIRLNPKPDLRTTIYWNAKLKSDATGLIQTKFYTADNSTNYSVILEGVSQNGDVCRFVGILKREDKKE